MRARPVVSSSLAICCSALFDVRPQPAIFSVARSPLQTFPAPVSPSFQYNPKNDFASSEKLTTAVPGVRYLAPGELQRPAVEAAHDLAAVRRTASGHRGAVLPELNVTEVRRVVARDARHRRARQLFAERAKLEELDVVLRPVIVLHR